MLVLDLIRVLRLPLARSHALRAAAQKDWPGPKSSQDSCPLRKTIWLSLVPGLARGPGQDSSCGESSAFGTVHMLHSHSPARPFTIVQKYSVPYRVHPAPPRSWQQVTGTSGALRRFPIESVDFLDAGVADQQRRLVRGDAGPVSESPAGRLKSFHAEEVKRPSSLWSEPCTR